MVQDYREYIDKVLVSEEQIKTRVRELGAEISRDYAGGEEILIVCICGGVA